MKMRTIGRIIRLDAEKVQIKEVDLAKAESRLEWVMQQNPEIDPDRISCPEEIMDQMYSGWKGFYKPKIKLGLTNLIINVGYMTLLNNEIRTATNNFFNAKDFSSFANAAYFMAPSIFLLYTGFYSLSNGITRYFKHKNEKWSKPLDEKERTLARYVFMAEKPDFSK